MEPLLYKRINTLSWLQGLTHSQFQKKGRVT